MYLCVYIIVDAAWKVQGLQSCFENLLRCLSLAVNKACLTWQQEKLWNENVGLNLWRRTIKHAHTKMHTDTDRNELCISSFPANTTAGAVKEPVAVWEALVCESELIHNWWLLTMSSKWNNVPFSSHSLYMKLNWEGSGCMTDLKESQKTDERQGCGSWEERSTHLSTALTLSDLQHLNPPGFPGLSLYWHYSFKQKSLKAFGHTC